MPNAGLNYCSKLEISLAKGAQVYFVPTPGTLDSLLAWWLHGCVSARDHVTLSSLCPGTGALVLEARGEEHTVRTKSSSEFSKSAQMCHSSSQRHLSYRLKIRSRRERERVRRVFGTSLVDRINLQTAPNSTGPAGPQSRLETRPREALKEGEAVTPTGRMISFFVPRLREMRDASTQVNRRGSSGLCCHTLSSAPGCSRTQP